MVRTAVAGEIIRMTEMTTPWAGDAMDTLKMKIGLITKESKESSAKMEKAEKVYISYILTEYCASIVYSHYRHFQNKNRMTLR